MVALGARDSDICTYTLRACSLFLFFETLFLCLYSSEWKDSVKSHCCVHLASSLPTCSPDVCGWLLTWVSFQCLLEPHGRTQVYNKLFHMIWAVQSGRTSGPCRAAFGFSTEGLSHRGCNTEGVVKSSVWVCSMLSFGDAFLLHIWAWALAWLLTKGKRESKYKPSGLGRGRWLGWVAWVRSWVYSRTALVLTPVVPQSWWWGKSCGY